MMWLFYAPLKEKEKLIRLSMNTARKCSKQLTFKTLKFSSFPKKKKMPSIDGRLMVMIFTR